MTNQLTPAVSVSISSAVEEVAQAAQKVLFIGQKTPAGSAVSGALNSNLQNDESALNALFGQDSMLAAMIRSARLLNDKTQFDAIALDDNGAGVDATGTIIVAGTATEDGTLTVVLGSEQNHNLSIAVTSGDTATVVGDTIAAAVTADLTAPANAVNVIATVTFTAVNAGTYGNSLALGISGSVAGITVSSVTGFASGATDPVLTAVFDPVGGTRYQGVVWPYPAVTSELTTFLEGRFNVDNDVLDGTGFTATFDSLANLQSTYGALNFRTLVVFGDKTISETFYKGPSVVEIPAVIASQFAAIRALRLTDGASIGQFVITNQGGLDTFGGPALASKPYFNTPLPNIPVSQVGRGWTQTEIGQLKTSGVSIVGNNRAANQITVGEVVTTYKTDAAGNPDVSFKFLNFVDTSSNVREFYFNNYRARFAQTRLTNGDLVPGRDMANKQLIEATSIEFYDTLSGGDFVLTQLGEIARVFFIDNLIVTLDLTTGTVTISMQTPLVTQLRAIIANILIVFSTDG